MNRQTLLILPVLLAGLWLCSPAASAAATAPDFDPEQRYAQVQTLRHAARFLEALAAIDPLLRRHPDNVDYLLAKAQILTALQREDEALDELARATELAPVYEDLWRLRFALLKKRAQSLSDEERIALQQPAAELFPAADWWQWPEPVNNEPWTVTIGAGKDTLSGDRPGWQHQFLSVSYQANEQTQVIADLHRESRFANTDTGFGAGVERQFPRDWFAGAKLLTVSSPHFQPDTVFSTHLGRKLKAGWVADFRYQQRDFENARVRTVTGALERYLGDYRFYYGLSLSRLQGASNSIAHAVSANRFFGEHTSLGISLNTGEEAEAIGNGRILTTDVRGVSLNGRHQLGSRYTLLWWLGMHDQGEIHRRRYLGMAVSIRL